MVVFCEENIQTFDISVEDWFCMQVFDSQQDFISPFPNLFFRKSLVFSSVLSHKLLVHNEKTGNLQIREELWNAKILTECKSPPSAYSIRMYKHSCSMNEWWYLWVSYSICKIISKAYLMIWGWFRCCRMVTSFRASFWAFCFIDSRLILF